MDQGFEVSPATVTAATSTLVAERLSSAEFAESKFDSTSHPGSYPKTSRNRLPPSQGMTTSVLSNPAAISNGLCARFWNFTTT